MSAEINRKYNVLDEDEALQRAKGEGSKSPNEKTRGAPGQYLHICTFVKLIKKNIC